MKRAELISYYGDLVDYYGKYHQHKEVSAWAGLALNVIFCGAAARLPVITTCKASSAIGITLAITLVGLLVYRYIRNQLELKDRGGALSAAALLFLTEIVATEEDSLNFERYFSMPRGSTDTNAQSSHVLPEQLLQQAAITNTCGRGFQDVTRVTIYGLLVMSCLTVIVFKLIEAVG